MCKAADFGESLCRPPNHCISVPSCGSTWRFPNFTSTVNVEKTPIEAADKAIIDGAWVDGWCRRPIFPWGGTSVNFLSLASGFLWQAPLDCEIHQNYSGRDRWPGRGGSGWKVGQHQKCLLSSPSPGAPESTCARALVHLNIYSRNHHRDLVEARWWVRALRILWDLRMRGMEFCEN